MALYADIVLPIAIGTLTYEVPDGLAAQLGEGDGVEVILGARKRYMGIVSGIHFRRPDYQRIKPIERILYGSLVTAEQLALWRWMAQYYMAPLGDVMRAALPSVLKPSGLSDSEFDDRVVGRRREPVVMLAERFASSEELLSEELDRLSRRAKARHRKVLELITLLTDCGEPIGAPLPLRMLGGMSPVIHALIDSGVLVLDECEVDLFANSQPDPQCKQLSEPQSRALAQIKQAYTHSSTVLLHGVTGSGKTEIYTHLIADELRAGRSVLYLLPEIAVTEQFIGRMESLFGSRVICYHSKLTATRRGQIYLNIAHAAEPLVVIGVRSSIFLPLRNLGLVIVDEEHDRSFKQEDPSPRYLARDCAVWMAGRGGVRTLLGSATPSVESYRNASGGRYGLVELTERFGEGRLPLIEISDTLRSAKRGERRGHINKELSDLMREALSNGRQVMLFQNRRGFAPYVECEECGVPVHCPHCSVTLSYHKSEGMLRCHHCGHRLLLPESCPECGKGALKPQGFGTEKIEEELGRLFPEARVARLDGDTATSPTRYSAIINDFAARRTDILVGTQMITKGFDFAGVSVVGVLNADNLLNFPDFRASERAFQTLTQIAGRAGRTDGEGRVVIQTSQPDHPTIAQVVSGDYRALFAEEMAARQIFGYPPLRRVVEITFRHSSREVAEEAAAWIGSQLRSSATMEVVGPYPPPMELMGGVAMSRLQLRLVPGGSAAAKRLVASSLNALASAARFKSVAVAVDVDPI